MQTEETKIEKRLEGLTPVRLKPSVKKRILGCLGGMFAYKPSPRARPSHGFIQVAVPFGMAAMFLATTSGHYLLATGVSCSDAVRIPAPVSCIAPAATSVSLDSLLLPTKSSSNTVADMDGHTNGLAVIGRTGGTAPRDSGCSEGRCTMNAEAVLAKKE